MADDPETRAGERVLSEALGVAFLLAERGATPDEAIDMTVRWAHAAGEEHDGTLGA